MLNNIRIGKKLTMAFALSIISLVFIIVLSFTGTSKVKNELDNISGDKFPKILWAHEISDQINVNARALRNIIIAPDQDIFNKEMKRLNETAVIVASLVDSLNRFANTDEEHAVINNLEKVRTEVYLPSKEKFITEINSGNKASASAMLFKEMRTSQQAYFNAIDKLVEFEEKQMKIAGNTADSAVSTQNLLMTIVGAISIGLVLLFSMLITKSIVTPVVALNGAAIKVASGDLDVSIEADRKDEIGILSSSFMKMTQNIKDSNEKLLLEKNSIAQKVEDAVRESEKQKSFLSDSVNNMLAEMDRFAEGDLTVNLETNDTGDIGRLYDGFNRATNNIRNLLQKLMEAVQATASSSTEISSSTEEMAAGAQEQSTQTGEIAAAIEQMTKTIVETTRNASQAAVNAKKAGEIASAGGVTVDDTVHGIIRIADVVNKSSETVKQLGKNSDQIGEIIQVIDDIADQTNLLALNAAIEAARAGEQGRGFAVVADEVRKLAERTTKATKEIADMIKQIQKDTSEAVVQMKHGTEEVEKGKELAKKAGESLKEIISASVSVVDDINQVATASEEQSATADQISKNIESISNVTNESSAGIQQVARAAEDLNRLTEGLQNLISAFRLNNDGDSGSSIRKNNKLVRKDKLIRNDY
jgi:methyl-accepting chemotaxis protein